MKPSVIAAEMPVIDQPVSRAIGRRNTGSENIAPIATQPITPPAATMIQRYRESCIGCLLGRVDIIGETGAGVDARPVDIGTTNGRARNRHARPVETKIFRHRRIDACAVHRAPRAPASVAESSDAHAAAPPRRRAATPPRRPFARHENRRIRAPRRRAVLPRPRCAPFPESESRNQK
ncbi:hypothetical protein [Burkholderia dolosa]|uniref:hypothetical protein n=1 Tax=Burkholderia dolosa TaxID=152500 RepID=UPI0027D2CD3B|nr:hypothetical protein [Burkholderia dolosa]